jgi:DNA adenine methylase
MHRSLIRYHGGKFQQAPWIISHFPQHRVYTEGCAGGGSILLRKPRAAVEIYNDIDGEIVNLFRVMRDSASAAELERVLRLTPYAREEFEASYLPADDPIEQARRTLVRDSMGYGSNALATNTGFRTYSGPGRSRPPVDDWVSLPDMLPLISRRLRGVVIEQVSIIDLLRKHDYPDSLHYVDPPYVTETRTTRTEHGHAGYKYDMTDDDHRELAGVLHSLEGAVVLSGYACPLYDDLYGEWKQVRRTVSGWNVERQETLWLNPQACRQQMSMEVAVWSRA